MNPPPKILDAEITPSQLKVKLDTGITVLMPLEQVPTLLLAAIATARSLVTDSNARNWFASCGYLIIL